MLYRQIQSNKRKTIGLVLLFCLLVGAVGGAIGYLNSGDAVGVAGGLLVAAVVLVFYLPITFLSARAQVLGMSGAKPATREDYPQLYNIVESLCIPARLPMPQIYVVNDPSPNAFATGRNPKKAAVAFTTGLLERLNREELEAVAAHELGHIRNYDIRLMTISIALISVVALLANLGSRMLFYQQRGRDKKTNPAGILIALVLIIFAPLAAQFVHFAISRNREFLADATAVEFTRNAKGMMDALIRIHADEHDVAKAKPATASMYIASPFSKNRHAKAANWFSTHPTLQARIERLERM